MEPDYFSKLCWVCLAEESNMHSILDDLKFPMDSNRCSPMSLCDLLTYVSSTQVLFLGGPFQICNNCKLQACAAYKFRKRCEISTQVFKKCGLTACRRDTFCKDLNLMKEGKDSKGPQIDSTDVTSYTEELNETEDVKQTNINFLSTENTGTADDCVLNKIDLNNSTVLLVEEDSQLIANQENKFSRSRRKAKTTKLRLPSSRTFLCAICGLQKSKNGIREHMLSHQNIKNHSCSFCPRRFTNKSNLNVHMRIHTGVHPYVCDICGKAFIQASGLKIHKRIHDNLKPYKCHICDYCTRTSSHLQLHIKRHIGVKNYHCEQCDYSACSKAELKYHMTKHSDAKCHICKSCGKAFARKKGLKTHEKSHTGERPYTCEICGRGFTQAHSLRSHLRNIHKKNNV